MLTIRDIQDIPAVVHTESGVECEILDHTLQIKLNESKWVPAISYRKKTAEGWREQIFVRDMASFMAKFSKKVEASE